MASIDFFSLSSRSSIYFFIAFSLLLISSLETTPYPSVTLLGESSLFFSGEEEFWLSCFLTKSA